ncbi:MAG: fructokinase [Rhodospirillaceae bacterium]|nr:fructokinase [Magnetovibrio sp.]MAY68557.1 fructokinase [Rhodospirillaceae bacterium]
MRAGIDLGGTKIEGLVLNGAGIPLARRRIAAPQGDYQATIRAICDVIRDLEAEAGPVGHVGVGIPGTISPATRLVKNANSTWLIGHPFDVDLESALGRPVRLANDANCFAVSEAADGAAQGAAAVFGVILGTGVGGGIALNGRPVSGLNAVAGEWGHNPLPWPRDDERPGPRCYCGLSGCIETFLSGPALAHDHLTATGENLSPPDIAARAEAGDAAADATLARYEDRLARALATVINLLDPDAIVLGGGLSNLSRLYANVPRLWGKWVFSDEVATRLVPARHGDASGVRGAAWLWPAEISSRP